MTEQYRWHRWVLSVELTGRSELRQAQRLILLYVILNGRREGSRFSCRCGSLASLSKQVGLSVKRIQKAKGQLQADGVILTNEQAFTQIQKQTITITPTIVRSIVGGRLPGRNQDHTAKILRAVEDPLHGNKQTTINANESNSERPGANIVIERLDASDLVGEDEEDPTDWIVRVERNYYSEIVGYQKRLPGSNEWQRINEDEYRQYSNGRMVGWDNQEAIMRIRK